MTQTRENTINTTGAASTPMIGFVDGTSAKKVVTEEDKNGLCGVLLMEVESSMKTRSIDDYLVYRGVSMRDLREFLRTLLRDLGIQTKCLGYDYIKAAVIICLADRKTLNSTTISLYGEIARLYDSTNSRVERAIRHAIETAVPNFDTLVKIFGDNKNYLANKEFISAVVEYIDVNI